MPGRFWHQLILLAAAELGGVDDGEGASGHGLNLAMRQAFTKIEYTLAGQRIARWKKYTVTIFSGGQVSKRAMVGIKVGF